MKKKNQDFWVGVDQLQDTQKFEEISANEFPSELPLANSLSKEDLLGAQASRRDFLKYLGFGLGAATLAASCDIPVKRAIPYVVKPDEIVPGIANYYASTFVRGGDYCSVLVKTREGRPIKIEGNNLCPLTQGGTSARAQASVLDLYNVNRYQGPGKMAEGQFAPISWADLDRQVKGALSSAAVIRVLTHTNLSPTFQAVLDEFTARYPGAKVLTYDPVSSSALLQASEAVHGQAVVPDFRFDQADVIVSFGADFLGTWISPVEYARQYASRRRVKDVEHPDMSYHVQVEAHMSMTGSNADKRIQVRPSAQGAAIAALYNALAGKNGAPTVSAPALKGEAAGEIQKLADRLQKSKGKALVVSGSNNLGDQLLVCAINQLLDSYGNTIGLDQISYQRQGLDREVHQLLGEMNKGAVDVLFVLGDANPAWELPYAAEFREAMKKVKFKLSTAGVPNETSSLCDYIAPDHHYLESWGDARPKAGVYSLQQPTIAPLFDTRQVGESFLRWAESPNFDAGTEEEPPYFRYVKKWWKENMFTRQNSYSDFQKFWDHSLHDGIVTVPSEVAGLSANAVDVSAAAALQEKPSSAELEMVFFETVNIGGGQYATNPWLQEMPDPVARTTWNNYMAIPIFWDGGIEWKAFKGLNQQEIYGKADKVEVEIGGRKQTVSCIRQFGLAEGTLAMALGYGREQMGVCGYQEGVNVNPWIGLDKNGNVRYYATEVAVSDKVGEDDAFACVQYHHTMGVKGTDPQTGEELNVDEKTVMTLKEGYQGGLTNRSVLYYGSTKSLEELVEHIAEKRAEAQEWVEQSLYPYDKYNEKFYSQGHHWGMHIDMNACIGCGACQVACVAENNVPVVGRKEVSRHHEMTWLRIDRYFFGDYKNPHVAYQPMMCQHCDNAPCENVCPVAATNHSSEGLNQMTYNRCIGTRYCANNCPYKVRRFNWMDYSTADIFPANEPYVEHEDIPFGADNLTRMVLNPDVTVRSRGVIEKCSFCVQRLQEGKLTAKKEQRSLSDADVRTACQTACPTGAITFGDMNLKEDLAAKLDSPLNYYVLEEVGVRPSVAYSAKVVNTDEELTPAKKHESKEAHEEHGEG